MRNFIFILLFVTTVTCNLQFEETSKLDAEQRRIDGTAVCLGSYFAGTMSPTDEGEKAGITKEDLLVQCLLVFGAF